MGYIEKRLMADENILLKSQIHRATYLFPGLLLLSSIIAIYYTTGDYQFYSIYGIITAVLWFIANAIERKSSLYVVTNKRILFKKGLLFSKALEIEIDNIEKVGVTQNIIAKMFGYGNIDIVLLGGSKTTLKKAEKPFNIESVLKRNSAISDYIPEKNSLLNKIKATTNVSNFEVVAGDFKKAKACLIGTNFLFDRSGFDPEQIPTSSVESLEMASEEQTKSFAGKIGMGVAGAAVLGPVGLLAGALVGGEKKHVVFVCEFKDGRRFLGKAKQKDFETLMTATFDFVTTPKVS